MANFDLAHEVRPVNKPEGRSGNPTIRESATFGLVVKLLHERPERRVVPERPKLLVSSFGKELRHRCAVALLESNVRHREVGHRSCISRG
jgi:hypothetical protein